MHNQTPVYTLIETPISPDIKSKLFLTDDPALVVLYAQLRQKTLLTLRGASKVTPQTEWEFIVHNARLYNRMGCDLLGLDLGMLLISSALNPSSLGDGVNLSSAESADRSSQSATGSSSVRRHCQLSPLSGASPSLTLASCCAAGAHSWWLTYLLRRWRQRCGSAAASMPTQGLSRRRACLKSLMPILCLTVSASRTHVLPTRLRRVFWLRGSRKNRDSECIFVYMACHVYIETWCSASYRDYRDGR